MKHLNFRTLVWALLAPIFIGSVFFPGTMTSLSKQGNTEPGGGSVAGKDASGKGSIVETTAKVPESPATEAYVPTKFKKWEPSTPGEGIDQMSTPAANSSGTAHLEMPLKLPPGRQGIQPQLALQYNSEGGLSWTGLGFDLSLPSVGIETRWGVPRYNPDLETESYMLEGASLFPLVYRDSLKNRDAEKRFYPRVEGAFRVIIRHGTNPKNYWWEVTEKDGTRRFFGGSPADNGVFDGAILRDDAGNIGHWALREIRDADDNFVRYHYINKSDTGLPNGTVPGQQIYPDKITYTGHGSEEGAFSVHFLRDSERKDVQITCHLGFKQVTTERLRRIEIKYQNNPVCSYELDYQEGAFFKTLLRSIVEKGRDGTEFTRHEFEYYDEVRVGGTQYAPFGNEQDWTVPGDGVNGPLLSSIVGFDNSASVISGSKSNSWGVSMSVTVGPPGSSACKRWSVGGNFGFNGSSSDGLTALVDINGDGLPDKVFREGGQLKFRANLSGPNGPPAFSGTPQTIKGISDFSRSKTRGNSKGVEANLDPFFVGHTWTKSRTVTDTYFADFNGDRLIDIAHKGRVYFNHLDPSTGTPVFTLDSGDTPSPIVASGAALDSTIYSISPGELDTLLDENPLHDIVRMWEAPLDGTVSIAAPIELVVDNSQEALEYSHEDGVRAIIQINGDEKWNMFLTPAMAGISFIPSLPANITVKKGDRVYFRVQSVMDGAYDRVMWDPVINYQNLAEPLIDPNGKNLSHYRASEDFLLTAPQVVTMPMRGTIRLEGLFVKELSSDTVLLEIVKNDTTILLSRIYSWDTMVQDSIQGDFAVDTMDALAFRLVSPTNVDWAGISWKPRFFYNHIDNGPAAFDSDGDPILEFSPAVNYTMYNRMLIRPALWVAPDSGTVEISAFNLVGNFFTLPPGKITLSAKGVRKLYGRTTFRTTTSSLQPLTGPTSFQVQVHAGDSLFLEYHIFNDTLVDSIRAHMPPLIPYVMAVVDGTSLEAGLFTRPKVPWLGPMYRGWGFFVYNGHRQRAMEDIHENELDDPPMADPGGQGDIPQTDADIPSDYDPVKAKYIMLYPDCKAGYWRGFDDLTWVGADTMSSSRFGEDDLRLDFGAADSTGAIAPRKITRFSSKNLSLGASIPTGLAGISASASGSDSDGKTEFVYTVQDFNKDGFPDAAGPDKMQYTNMRGGLEAEAVYHGMGNQKADSHQSGISTSGSIAGAKIAQMVKGFFSANKTAQAKTENANNQSAEAQKGAKVSSNFSVNAGIGFGSEETADSWIDLNGDGLPDKVFRDGQVALNLGYRFAAKENWGFTGLQTGESADFSGGAGLGFSWCNGSVSGGLGLSKTINGATLTLQDVNGDGLVDILFKYNGQVIAHINYGNGFSADIPWVGATSLDEGESVGESANGAFTVCINLFFFRICFNPGGNIGRGISRQKSQITDIDGDGNPDFLTSGDDDELKVRRSNIGRTNLLRSVKRPLGTSFELTYDRAGNTYDMPSSKWVLSSVDLYDGFDGDGADHQKWAFEYKDGYFDRHEREFYGFETVYTRSMDTQNNDAIYTTTVQVFDRSSYYRKGLLLSDTLFAGPPADGVRFSVNRQEWALKDIFTGLDFQANQYPDAGGTAYPAMIVSESFFPEGNPGPGLSTRQAYGYDSYGNIIDFSDSGGGSDDDLVHATIAYHNHAVFKSVPRSIEVRIGSSQELKRHRETEMNATGNITQIRQYLTPDTSAVFDLEYDDYGNLLKITRPANHKGQRLYYTYSYDSDVHTYVIETLDAYGYRSTNTYDPVFGKLLETADLNGNRTRYTLDANGRVTTVTGPYEIAAGHPYTLAFEYHPEATVPYAVTRHFDPETGGDIETVTFTDGLARPIQVKKTGIISTSEVNVMIVSGRVIFDAFGRVIEAYHPITETSGTSTVFNPVFDGITPTKTTYDEVGRTRITTLPDGATTALNYDIAADNSGQPCFQTVATDALGNFKETFTDMRGRNRALKENGPDSVIWTDYRYNALSELLEITDDGGNKIAYTYDNLGRKRIYIHPDAGLTEWTYDMAGNPLRKITANIRQLAPNGGAIVYDYDYERVLKIDYPKNFQNGVQFHYGDSTALHNRKGRIYLREDASGGQEFFFGPLGEITKTIRTILVQNTRELTYVFENEYDTWNRVQKMIYPDGEVVEYGYNAAGQLRNISSSKLGNNYALVNKITYDKFGQRERLELGNGAVTDYMYEPERRRLQRLVTTGPDGRVIMSNTYTYDAMDNVMSITNAMPVVNLQIGGPSTHTFEYDKLYRLIGATGNWSGFNRSQSYSLAMEYDNLHNILRKNQQVLTGNQTEAGETTYNNNYEYKDNRPHIPTKVGTREFKYDADGNQTGWQEELHFAYREMKWDEERRLQSIWDNGHLSLYTYDADGERALKSHGGVQAAFLDGAPAGFISHFDNWTAYVSPYFVAREQEFTKHYFIESQRIASREGAGKFNHPTLPGPKITAGSLDYRKRMNLLEKAAHNYYLTYNQPPGEPTYYTFGQQPDTTGNPIPVLQTGNYDNPPGWPKAPLPPPDYSQPPGKPIKIGADITNDNVSAGFNFTGYAGFPAEANQYFFHPDHLGSTSYVTDKLGNIRQHAEYLPFGETFVEEFTQDGAQNYLFNAKEYDRETGLYYYGARYYDPRLSIWASVDPMAEERAGISPYNYVQNKPLNRIDPTGALDEEMCSSNNQSDFDLGIDQQSTERSNQTLFDFIQNSKITPDNGKTSPAIESKKGVLKTLNNVNEKVENAASYVEYTAGKATIGNNLSIYPSGWGGGSPARIKTLSLSKVGKGIGIGGAVVGTGLDAIGVVNHYRNGENSPNSVKPSEAVSNALVRGLGFVISVPYMILFWPTDAH